MSIDNNNNSDTRPLERVVLGAGESIIHLKSGQSLEPFPGVEPLRLPSPLSSLADLKALVSRHLGNTSDIVLARGEEGALDELKEGDISSLKKEETFFVFSSKSWSAYRILQGTSSSAEDRRKAVVEGFSSQGDVIFLRQLREAQQASFKDNKAIQEGKKRLAERAALFGLQENDKIDQVGDCQFDAAADQLKKYEKFAGETKESVRARAVRWIRGSGMLDLGHGSTLRKWVEDLGSFDHYVQEMSHTGCWGDEVSLLAICESYQLGIVMLSSVRGGNWYRVLYPAGKNEKAKLPLLWLGHEYERHYWSLEMTLTWEDSQIGLGSKRKELIGSYRKQGVGCYDPRWFSSPTKDSLSPFPRLDGLLSIRFGILVSLKGKQVSVVFTGPEKRHLEFFMTHQQFRRLQRLCNRVHKTHFAYVGWQSDPTCEQYLSLLEMCFSTTSIACSKYCMGVLHFLTKMPMPLTV